SPGRPDASRWTAVRGPGRSLRSSSPRPTRAPSWRAGARRPHRRAGSPRALPRMPDHGVLLTEARRELARLLPALDLLTGDLDDESWRERPAAAEWSPVEIVCHLRDEETEDFPARLRVAVTGGQRFAPIDPERWAIERRYREADPRQARDALRALRRGSLEFLASLEPGRLAAAVEHPRAGPPSGPALVAAWVAHDRLHLHQLTGTLARLWAARWAPLRTDYAGPIPYGPGAGD